MTETLDEFLVRRTLEAYKALKDGQTFISLPREVLGDSQNPYEALQLVDDNERNRRIKLCKQALLRQGAKLIGVMSLPSLNPFNPNVTDFRIVCELDTATPEVLLMMNVFNGATGAT